MDNPQAALLAATQLFADSVHRHDTEAVLARAEDFLTWLESKEQPEEHDRQLDFSSTTERADPPDTDKLEMHKDTDREPTYRKAGF